jgi:anti-sigma-K factor RskA
VTGHDDLRDLVASVALGAASPQEEALLEAHTAACPECAEALVRARAGASALALSVPQVDPPPSLRRSVMDVVQREAALSAPRVQGAPAAAPREGRLRRLLPGRAGLWPVLAGGLAVLLAVTVVWSAVPGGGGAPERVPVVAAATGVAGEATVLTGGDTAVLRMTGLPALPAGRGYEVWVLRDGAAPRSAGFMTARGDGVVAVADDLDGATALAVTPEELTNTAAPSSTPLATVDLRSG